MDFNTLANGIYANINTAAAVGKGRTTGISGRAEFLEEAWRASQVSAGKLAAEKLYAGCETRATLTETEIAVLRNKYDVRDMSDEQYDAFLDDLEDMGAISQWEKGLLGYKGDIAVSYQGKNGEIASERKDISVICEEIRKQLHFVSVWSYSGVPCPAFSREETNGDILMWVTDRLKWKPEGKTPEMQKAQAEAVDTFETLSGILSRMTGTQPVTGEQGGTADGEEAPSLIDQIADPNSAFYQDMLQKLRLQWEQSEEDKKEQAIIDALGAILDGMRSTDGVTKRKDVATSMAGLSKQISELDEEDPRRAQLDLFRQRLNQLGIFVDLDLGVKGGKDKDEGWLTLTERLIDEENSTFDPSIFDLI